MCLRPGPGTTNKIFACYRVSCSIFDGSENEDYVFEFLDKFKRAARLNGWNDDDLPIGLPLYLKGHASA